MKKRLVGILLVLSMMVSLVGCSSESESTASTDGDDTTTEKTEKASEVKESSEEQVTLTWLLSGDAVDGSANSKMAEQYEKETGVHIEIIDVPYADMDTKLMNMIRAGNAPALVRGTGVAQFSDFLLPIDDVIDRDVILDSRLDAVLINDELIAIPTSLTANGMFYNKTLFEQAGVEVPTGDDDLWSWDEFVVAVEEVVANSDAEYGLVWDHSQHRYSTLLYQFGGSLYNEDLTATRIANQNSIDSLNFFVSLFEKNIIPASSWIGGEDPSAMFMTGNVAVHFSGSWKVASYLENITDFEWGALLMPYAENRSSVPGGTFTFAIDGTGVEEETKAFVEWLYEPENYTTYCEYGQFLPGQKDINPAYDSEASSILKQELENTPRAAGIDMTIGNKYPGDSFGNALRDNIDLAVLGEMTTEEALLATEQTILETFEGMESER